LHHHGGVGDVIRPAEAGRAHWEALTLTLALAHTPLRAQHYDGCSESYQNLWGVHIHHGLWRDEAWSKERAADNLVDELLARSGLRAAARAAAEAGGPPPTVLDVGCGVGGTSIRLASLLGVKCVGVTLSPKQVEMAAANAAAANVADGAAFHVGDAEALLEHPALAGRLGTFDAVWCSESASHYPRKPLFFDAAAKFLKPGGRLVMCDWLKAEHLGARATAPGGVIDAIEIGMLLPPLCTATDYVRLAGDAGLRPVFYEDVSKETARTWDISLGLVSNPAVWALATSMGPDFIAFLKSFTAMRDGFATGAFRFALFVCEKPTAEQLE